MRAARETATALALIALTFSVPGALAAYLLAASPRAPTFALAATAPAGSENGAGSRAGDAGLPSMAGLLFTRGAATVDWNGVAIPVENGTYAYAGGEIVTTGPDAMSVLRLDGGSVVFMCPGARASVERVEGGGYRLRVLSGSARFSFAPGQAYRVEANGIGIGPPAGADAARPSVGEVDAPARGGCLLCGLSNAFAVGDAVVPTGRMLNVAPEPSPGVPGEATSTPIPAAFADAFGAGAAAAAGAGGNAYLCRCREIHRYATAAPPGEPTDPQSPVAPPDTAQRVEIPAAPPVAPPEVAALAVADPGAPDPFDPNVLPAPAAGQPAAAPAPSSESFSVAPPLVPSGGSGGGGSASPS